MKILVFGGCNIDFNIHCKDTIIKGTSNISSIEAHPGGVGRNIAENLLRLGFDVSFITALGNDFYSKYIEDSMNELNIDLRPVKKEKTGIYIAVIDSAGRLDTGYNDMKSIEEVTYEDINSLDLDLKTADGAVIDANFNSLTITELCKSLKNSNIPYAIETVSIEKSQRVKEVINGCTLIKPSMNEAEQLTCHVCRNKSDVVKCAEILYSMGAKNVIISMGKFGFYYYNGNCGKAYDADSSKIIDVTGAGDALIASAFACILKGLGPDKICTTARYCAALACASNDAVSHEITPSVFQI